MMPLVLRRATTRLALMVWLASAALPVVQAHGALNEDVACDWLIASDGRAAALVPSADAPAHEHCVICHLQRACGRAATAPGPSSPILAQTTATACRLQGSPRRQAAALLPSRAPPAPLASAV